MKSGISEGALRSGALRFQFSLVGFLFWCLGYKGVCLALFRVSHSGLFLSTSMVPFLRTGEPLLPASAWETWVLLRFVCKNLIV